MNAISLKDVWLKYRVEFKEDGKVIPEDFWALKEVNMEVAKGEAICIIGENGAGKTTLLKTIAGMLKPDKGSVQVNGTVSALMEIGAGFHKDLTGRENIYLTSSFFGLNIDQIDTRYNDIVKFASIGRFINAQVKTYSQGMYMRLAFAIAIHVNPDILLVDDMFVVGDLYAQRKCINKMLELKEKGKTLIFVSHDIETAKCFCQRGILLKDGRAIKYGRLQETINYYLKTVGDKKGIGILQGKRLGLVFNNGKIILNWFEENITKEWGGHAAILSSGNWHPSLQADWEIIESKGDRIVVEGTHWDLPVSQLWHIRLDDDKNEIEAQLALKIHRVFDFQECKLSFMLKEDYNQWFDAFEKKSFAGEELDKTFYWQCVNANASTNFIGLSNINTSGAGLPGVIFEDDYYLPGKLLQIQNTDRVFKARVLQSRIIRDKTKTTELQAGTHLLFHIRTRVLDNQAEENQLRENISKTMLPKVIGDNVGLLVSADEFHRISLTWRNKKITASKGLQTSFYYNGNKYFSSDGTISIHRISQSRLEIAIDFTDISVKQIWDIELSGDNILLWKVYMQVLEKIVVRNQEFSIMLSADYREWFSIEDSGRIADELDAENGIIQNHPYGIIGVKEYLADNIRLPALLIHDTSERAKFNSVVKTNDKNMNVSVNTQVSESVVRVYFLGAEYRDSAEFTRGLHLIHNSRILIGDSAIQKDYINAIDKEKTRPSIFIPGKNIPHNTIEESIKDRDYEFKFIKGRGELSSRNKAITKKFGVHTAVYSQDFSDYAQWHTSLEAIWEVLVLKRHTFVIKGLWSHLPLVQTWEIKSAKNGFSWKVEMEIFAPVSIQKQQAYIMLSEAYSSWSASTGENGLFPQDFTQLQWDNILKQTRINCLSAAVDRNGGTNALPRLDFLCFKDTDTFEATVENTNLNFASRVLGFEKKTAQNNQILKPGLYRYFDGAIIFPPA